jgi:hypothetical protein
MKNTNGQGFMLARRSAIKGTGQNEWDSQSEIYHGGHGSTSSLSANARHAYVNA